MVGPNRLITTFIRKTHLQTLSTVFWSRSCLVQCPSIVGDFCEFKSGLKRIRIRIRIRICIYPQPLHDKKLYMLIYIVKNAPLVVG